MSISKDMRLLVEILELPLMSRRTVVRGESKLRRSLSPLKVTEHMSPTSQRARSVSPAKQQADPSDLGMSVEGGSWIFEDFSFLTEDGGFQNISGDHMERLLEFLDKKYGVFELMWSGIFLIVSCRGEAPPSDKRPFTIAGCIGVWLADEDIFPWGILIPTPANGEDLKLPSHLVDDLQQYKIPRMETLEELWRSYFPDALQIQYYVSGIIVELPEVNPGEHCQRMETLPNSFVNSNASLSFSNGLRPLTELARLKQPEPRYRERQERQEDDTDYVQEVGYASPGAVISSSTGEISAGILVQRDGEQRLTAAMHCWDEELNTIPERLGDPRYFTLTQGQTPIGHLTERVGGTDIGLAILKKGVRFSNHFLDIPASAKSLLMFKDIRMGDQFMLDSFTTGVQTLSCLGCIVREPNVREKHFVQIRDEKGQRAPLPGDGKFVILNQGIYATNAPESFSKPIIRAGVCGSALVRCRSTADARATVKEVLAKGEIGGFMHWSDLQRKSTPGGTLVCLCDCVDELVKGGWNVVQDLADGPGHQ